jgi:hypothetical protein
MKITANYLSIGLLLLLCNCSYKEDPKPKAAPLAKQTTTNKQSPQHKPSEITCEQRALSKQFDIILNATHDRSLVEGTDSCMAKLVMREKNTQHKLDSFSLVSYYCAPCVFEDCSKVRSYTTGYKADEDVIDGYYGDIVVADLNFDGRDDIAVINDCGGNGGPLYSYYLQNKRKQFVLDKFLTNEMIFFPYEIDIKRKRLTTMVHAGACCVSETVYQYTQATGKWKKISERILGAD